MLPSLWMSPRAAQVAFNDPIWLGVHAVATASRVPESSAVLPPDTLSVRLAVWTGMRSIQWWCPPEGSSPTMRNKRNDQWATRSCSNFLQPHPRVALAPVVGAGGRIAKSSSRGSSVAAVGIEQSRRCRAGEQPYRLQRLRIGLRARRWARLVDHRHGARRHLLRPYLPPLPR